MLIYDDIYVWEGWGGKLKLGNGRCRLRIYDLSKDRGMPAAHLRPFIVVVSDIPESPMTVKSCAGHIATGVIQKFDVDPHRMLWVEYYRQSTYGDKGRHQIPEKLEAVEFDWHDGKAIKPRWRELPGPLQELVISLITDSQKLP